MAALSSSSRSSAGNTPSFVGNSSVPTAASVVSRPPRSREALASFASDPALQGSVPDAASLRPVASSLLAPRLKHHPSSSGLKASVGPWSPALPAPASGPFSQQPAYSMYAPHALDAWAPLGTALPEPAAAATPSAPVNDDIIPNAIVIKNIPFSLPFEALTALMVDLALPMPYAFNYHYDQGVFRGLAFANFRAAEDAGKVLAALNGFDVSGRKLKTEYKKVLQAEERERIQKQKALQRMQSFQIEKSKERQRRQMIADIHQERTASPTTTCTTSISNSPKSNRSYGSSLLSLNPTEPDSGVYPVRAPFSLNPVNTNGTGCMALPRSPSVGTCSFMLNSGQKDELDMNDPVTLDIYSRILLFTDDRMHDEISFSKSLSPSEHRVVHAVAERLGLFHYSVGYGEETRAVVSKVRPSSPQLSAHLVMLDQRGGSSNDLSDTHCASVAPGNTSLTLTIPSDTPPTGKEPSAQLSSTEADDAFRPHARITSMRSYTKLGSSGKTGTKTDFSLHCISPQRIPVDPRPEARSLSAMLSDLTMKQDLHSPATPSHLSA